MGVQFVYKAMTAKEKKLLSHVLALKKSGYSLRRMQSIYPASIAVLSRLTKGVFPQSPLIRCGLGLTTLPFEKRLAGHPDKESILAIYEVLKRKDAPLNLRQLSLFP